jgi:chromosomal replication initiator protein
MTLATDTRQSWSQFLEYVKKHCSATAYGNWLAPIKLTEATEESVTLEVPNIFVKEYLVSNYKKDLCAFFPVDKSGEPCIKVIIAPPLPEKVSEPTPTPDIIKPQPTHAPRDYIVDLNPNYVFDNFIEGPANQFVKSAAWGVAQHPGQTYSPLFIFGGVGLGKTHMLHSVGHHVRKHHPRLKVQCITTEQFINDLVDSLRNKSVDKMKRYYRNEIDVLLIDDIQFLENRLNFEEEISNTIEALINQKKQIIITSDKPPSQLKLSERLTARMEWGLVAHMGIPELETRVAILQYKAQMKGMDIPQNIAFYIAEHIYNNVRQLEGAINKLSAHSRLLNLEISEDMVERALREMFQAPHQEKISVEQILKSVASVFDVRITDLRGSIRTKQIALPRQVAMYLACKLINESLQMLGASFGKTHSTLLHAKKSIEQKIQKDDHLRRQVNMVERNISASAA